MYLKVNGINFIIMEKFRSKRRVLSEIENFNFPSKAVQRKQNVKKSKSAIAILKKYYNATDVIHSTIQNEGYYG